MSVFRIVKDFLAAGTLRLNALVLPDVWSNWFVPDRELSPVVVPSAQNRPRSRSAR